MNRMMTQKFIKVCLYIIMVLTPFRVEFEIFKAVISPLELIIYLLFFLTIKRLFLSLRTLNIKFTYLWLFSVFYLFSILSKIYVLEPESFLQGAWHIFKNLLDPFPLICIIIIFNMDTKTIKKAIFILIIFTTLSSLVGIVQTLTNGKYLTGVGVYGKFKFLGIYPPLPSDFDPLGKLHLGKVSIVTHLPNSNVFRAHGGLAKHNCFGAFLVLISLITLSVALNNNYKLFFTFLIQLLALTFTFSRSAYIGFLISIFLLSLVLKSLKKLFYIMIIILIYFMILVSFVPHDIRKQVIYRFETIFKAHEQIEVQARENLFKICVNEILKKPLLGHGTGGVRGFEIGGYPLTCHNDILDILYTRGVIVFITIYFLYILTLIDALTVWKKETDHKLGGYAIGFFWGFIGILVTGLAQSILLIKDTAPIVWVSIGMIVSMKKNICIDKNRFF